MLIKPTWRYLNVNIRQRFIGRHKQVDQLCIISMLGDLIAFLHKAYTFFVQVLYFPCKTAKLLIICKGNKG